MCCWLGRLIFLGKMLLLTKTVNKSVDNQRIKVFSFEKPRYSTVCSIFEQRCVLRKSMSREKFYFFTEGNMIQSLLWDCEILKVLIRIIFCDTMTIQFSFYITRKQKNEYSRTSKNDYSE